MGSRGLGGAGAGCRLLLDLRRQRREGCKPWGGATEPGRRLLSPGHSRIATPAWGGSGERSSPGAARLLLPPPSSPSRPGQRPNMQCALTSAVAVAPARVSSQRPSRRAAVLVRAEEAKAAAPAPAPEPKVRLLQALTTRWGPAAAPCRPGGPKPVPRSHDALDRGLRAARRALPPPPTAVRVFDRQAAAPGSPGSPARPSAQLLALLQPIISQNDNNGSISQRRQRCSTAVNRTKRAARCCTQPGRLCAAPAMWHAHGRLPLSAAGVHPSHAAV